MSNPPEQLQEQQQQQQQTGDITESPPLRARDERQQPIDTEPSPPCCSPVCSPVQKVIRFDAWQAQSPMEFSAVLKQLADLCATSKHAEVESYRQDFCRAQGTSVVAGIMTRWYNSPKIQALGCLVLHNASKTTTTTTTTTTPGNNLPPMRDVLGVKDTGALDAVLWAMAAYPTILPVQLCACGFLSQTLQVHENAMYTVQQLKGLERIVGARQRFPNNPTLQKWARACIEVLLNYREFRGTFLDTWVRQAVVSAITVTDQTMGAQTMPTDKKRKLVTTSAAPSEQ